MFVFLCPVASPNHGLPQQRRCKLDYQRVVDELIRRDSIDSTRNDSPLLLAEDAIKIETEEMNIDEVVGRIMLIVGPD